MSIKKVRRSPKVVVLNPARQNDPVILDRQKELSSYREDQLRIGRLEKQLKQTQSSLVRSWDQKKELEWELKKEKQKVKDLEKELLKSFSYMESCEKKWQESEKSLRNQIKFLERKSWALRKSARKG